MGFAVTNPFCWPEVRRGGERLQWELCHYLAKRGHDITLLASAPVGQSSLAEAPEGVHKAIVERQYDALAFRHYLTPAHEFSLRARQALRDIAPDAIYALTYFDADAALHAFAGRSRPRLVAHSIGVPVREVYRRMPWDGQMMKHTIRNADAVLVLSRFAADHMVKGYDRMPEVLPAPVNIGMYDAKTQSPEAPVILFSGDVNEPRKGADLLVRAVERLVRDHPDIRLVFTGRASQKRITTLRALSEQPDQRLQFLGTGRQEDLPALYRDASVLVLPSSWEAFGLVLIEALASGTPVVAAQAGGGADIIHQPEIGRLADLHADDAIAALARAIAGALELATDPSTIPLCRARAEDYTWEKLGPAFEASLQ